MKIELDDELIKRLERIIDGNDLMVEFSSDEVGYSIVINDLFERFIDEEYGVDEEMLNDEN